MGLDSIPPGVRGYWSKFIRKRTGFVRIPSGVGGFARIPEEGDWSIFPQE